MNVRNLLLILTAKDETSVAIRAVAGAIGSVLTGALADAARAGAEEEANTAKLAQAFANAGQTGGDLADAEARIAQQQAELAFSDSSQRNSLSELITLTKNADKAFQLQAIAMDVARAKSVDLETATRLIERVYSGSTGAAERYGFAIRDGSSATQALAQIQVQAAGQAQAFADTSAGSIAKIKNWIDDLREGVGQSLGPWEQYIALLPGVSAGFTGIAAGATAALPLIKELFTFIKITAIPALLEMDVALAPILAGLAVLAGGALIGYEAASVISGQGLSPLPGFAAGGIVPGPMGAPVPIMAHGGERYLGVGGAARGGGGDTYHFDFGGAYIYGMADFEQQVATAVRNVSERGGFRGVTT